MTMLQRRGRAHRPPEFLLIRGCRTFALVAAVLAAQGCGGGSVTVTVDVTTAVDGGGSDTPAVDGGGGGMDGAATDSGGGTQDSGGGTTDAGGSTDGGIVSPRGTGQTVMMAVGAAGATINLESLRLEIPGGALNASAMLTVTSSTEAPPAGLLTVAPIFRFGPDGTRFTQPVTVSFALPTQAPRPRIFWTAPGTNTFQEAGTWLREGRLYAQVSHFSGGTVVQTPAPTCVAPQQSCMAPCAIPTMPGQMCPVCVDPQTDSAHCGACGTACTTGQTCVAGRCAAAAAAGLATGDDHTCAIVGSAVQCWGANNFGQLGVGNTEPTQSCATVQGLTNPVEISAGRGHTCARQADGRVLCWGFNSDGQIGNGARDNNVLTAVPVAGVSNAVEVSSGFAHSCARVMDGRVFCWGYNFFGGVGNGQMGVGGGVPTPVQVMNLTNAVEVKAGYAHTCARVMDGRIFCWGINGHGGLGNGMEGFSAPTPVQVMGITNPVEIAVGDEHTCARQMDGRVLCWGMNNRGQLGNGTTTRNSLTPVAVTGLSNVVQIESAGRNTCARQMDGRILCWGGYHPPGLEVSSPTPIAVTGVTDPVEIEVGYWYSCARQRNGRVVCWRYTSGGTGLAVAGMPERCVGGCATGQTACGGACVDTQTSTAHCGACGVACATGQSCSAGRCEAAPIGLSGGAKHTCAIVTGGVQCWGGNAAGQLGVENDRPSLTCAPVAQLTSAPRSITLGSYHGCALLQDGTVSCWGRNASGQLGDNSTIARFRPFSPVQLVAGAVEVAAGNDHSCARLASGAVRCWGRNAQGQLGDGSTMNRLTSVAATGITDAVEIAAGGNHTCARLAAGGVRCWGMNNLRQLNDGSTTDRSSPVVAMGISNVVDIAAGGFHTCAVQADGTVRCWGDNRQGQLGDGTTTARTAPVAVTGVSNAVAVSAGFNHTCALLRDGGVRCWGLNFGGQLGDNTTTNRPTPVAALGVTGAVELTTGWDHTCARLADRSVRCWGTNDEGQVGDGTTVRRAMPGAVACVACPMAQVRCAGACVDTQISATNCGACGNACATGQSCNAGACGSTRPMCASGQTDCSPMSPTPTCANTQNSNANCGACGNACASWGTCSAGACQRDCTSFCARFAACPGFDAAACAMDCPNPTAISIACLNCVVSQPVVCDISACETACAP